ncbi:MAG TPA: hypothetical protein V6C97_01505 [Oculatellaceae cyanobacterium]
MSQRTSPFDSSTLIRQFFASLSTIFLLSTVLTPFCSAGDSLLAAAEAAGSEKDFESSKFSALAAATGLPVSTSSSSPQSTSSTSTIAAPASTSSPPSTVRLATSVQLSPEALSMAQQLKLFDQIGRLNALTEKISEAKAESNSLEALSLRQDTYESKQRLTRRILRTALEADYVVSAIDGEQNDTSRLNRLLAANRDNAILLNTVMAQLVNGVFWSLSGTFTMVSIDHAQGGNPDGISSIIAGMIPATLGLFSLYQASGPHRKLIAHPNMLAPIIGVGTTDDGYYPESVLSFLNGVPSGSTTGLSRKQELIKAWTDAKYIGKNGSLPTDSKTALVTGTTTKRWALTMSLLQTRQAMLSDLRTVVCQMKRGLVELMPLVE